VWTGKQINTDGATIPGRYPLARAIAVWLFGIYFGDEIPPCMPCVVAPSPNPYNLGLFLLARWLSSYAYLFLLFRSLFVARFSPFIALTTAALIPISGRCFPLPSACFRLCFPLSSSGPLSPCFFLPFPFSVSGSLALLLCFSRFSFSLPFSFFPLFVLVFWPRFSPCCALPSI